MPDSISNDDFDHIQALVVAGKKIEAIKWYRDVTGAGLAEAKQAVEALEAGGAIGGAAMASASKDNIDQIQAAVFAGKKILAIKLYRSTTGQGLKESKDFVEALEAELRRTEPDKFTAPPAKGCGMAAAVIIAVATAIGLAVRCFTSA